MRALLLIPLIAGLVYAQEPDSLELRGIVLEIGPNTPLAGAQITVYQFGQDLAKTVFGTIVTDSNGAFQFKPTRAGKYYLEAAKPDYFSSTSEVPLAIAAHPSSTTGALVTLSKEHPSEDLRLALMRFGELRGKVVDDDGKPVSRLQVELIPEKSAVMPAFSAASKALRSLFSAADGSFLAKDLAPGNYVVRVSGPRMKAPQADFSADDENAVDEDYATSYWPGVAERASASTATVSPGGSLDLGNIRLHKEPRYRVHFVVHGCEPGDQLSLLGPQDEDFLQAMNIADFAGNWKLLGSSEPGLPCRDLLVGGLAAGSYRFVATTQHGAAIAPFTITDRNATVPLTLIPDGDVLGRVVTASGDPPPPRQPALQTLAPGGVHILPDAKGNFTITGARCLPAELMLSRLDHPYYIKEFRIDGVAVSGVPLTLCAGSRVEIVLDDKTAALTVSIAGDKPASDPIVVVQRWPESLMDPTAKSGPLNLAQLAPGEYRVLAMRPVALADGQDVQSLIPQLMDRATKVTLEAGDTKTVSVNLIDPFSR